MKIVVLRLKPRALRRKSNRKLVDRLLRAGVSVRVVR